MTYAEARARAGELADATGFDHGIERVALASDTGFRVFTLPRRENRRGFELRCEVVHPSTLEKCQPGHGP